jgi:hypothetical protein
VEAQASRFCARQEAQDRVEPGAGVFFPLKRQRALRRRLTGRTGLLMLEWQEQFRIKEAVWAEVMFGGMPSDGVQYDEPNLSSTEKFSLEVSGAFTANLSEGKAQQIAESFIEAHVGRAAREKWGSYRQMAEAVLDGELSPHLDDQLPGTYRF